MTCSVRGGIKKNCSFSEKLRKGGEGSRRIQNFLIRKNWEFFGAKKVWHWGGASSQSIHQSKGADFRRAIGNRHFQNKEFYLQRCSSYHQTEWNEGRPCVWPSAGWVPCQTWAAAASAANVQVVLKLIVTSKFQIAVRKKMWKPEIIFSKERDTPVRMSIVQVRINDWNPSGCSPFRGSQNQNLCSSSKKGNEKEKQMGSTGLLKNKSPQR